MIITVRLVTAKNDKNDFCDSVDFSKWRPSAMLNLFGAYLYHPWGVFRRHYHHAKFGCTRYSSYNNTEVLILAAFVWKMPILIMPQKLGFRGFGPLNKQ